MEKEKLTLNANSTLLTNSKSDLIVTEKVVIIPRHTVVKEEELRHLLPQLKPPKPDTSQRKYLLDRINAKAMLNSTTQYLGSFASIDNRELKNSYTDSVSYGYIAPTILFSSLEEKNNSFSTALHLSRFHKDSANLVLLFLLPMLAVLLYPEYKYYSKEVIDKIYPKLRPLLLLGENNFLESHFIMVFIKEFLTAYFSYKACKNKADYFSWPNKENKHSAINDFFESFYLNHVNKVNYNSYLFRLKRYREEGKLFYYISTKVANLLFMRFNKFGPYPICCPLIYDLSHSWKDSLELKIHEDLSRSIRKRGVWNFMDIKNYSSDTQLYLLDEKEKDLIEKNINKDVSGVAFMPTYDENNTLLGYMIPGLKQEIQEELLFALYEVGDFFFQPHKPRHTLNHIFYEPELLETGYPELDKLMNIGLVNILTSISDTVENDICKYRYEEDTVKYNLYDGFSRLESNLNCNEELVSILPYIKDLNHPLFKNLTVKKP